MRHCITTCILPPTFQSIVCTLEGAIKEISQFRSNFFLELRKCLVKSISPNSICLYVLYDICLQKKIASQSQSFLIAPSKLYSISNYVYLTLVTWDKKQRVLEVFSFEVIKI